MKKIFLIGLNLVFTCLFTSSINYIYKFPTQEQIESSTQRYPVGYLCVGRHKHLAAFVNFRQGYVEEKQPDTIFTVIKDPKGIFDTASLTAFLKKENIYFVNKGLQNIPVDSSSIQVIDPTEYRAETNSALTTSKMFYVKVNPVNELSNQKSARISTAQTTYLFFIKARRMWDVHLVSYAKPDDVNVALATLHSATFDANFLSGDESCLGMSCIPEAYYSLYLDYVLLGSYTDSDCGGILFCENKNDSMFFLGTVFCGTPSGRFYADTASAIEEYFRSSLKKQH
jgi:hypothetical protein